MISHRQIMLNIATSLARSVPVAQKAVETFGRPLEIIVGSYGQNPPGVNEAPFLWMAPEPVENEEVASDQTFAITCVVAAAVKGPKGEKIILNRLQERTATETGLVVNGGNKIVEGFRDYLVGVVKAFRPGAILDRVRRTESDVEHFPLSWAVFNLEFSEPETL